MIVVPSLCLFVVYDTLTRLVGTLGVCFGLLTSI